MLRYIFKNSNIILRIYNDQILNPNSNDIPRILEQYHANPISGHTGFHRTYNRIKNDFKWEKMKSDIKKFIRQCKSCQRNKLVRKKNHQPMEITSTSNKPFEKISLDIVGPLTLTENGNKYILTLQDDLTKFTQAYAIPVHDAQTIADRLVRQFICKFGIPEKILTDQGQDFMSKLLKDVSKLLKIKQLHTTAYHPQSNGSLERSHSTIIEYLKHYVNEGQTDWDEWLDFAMFSFNTTTHSSTQFTPHELIFGKKGDDTIKF